MNWLQDNYLQNVSNVKIVIEEFQFSSVLSYYWIMVTEALTCEQHPNDVAGCGGTNFQDPLQT